MGKSQSERFKKAARKLEAERDTKGRPVPRKHSSSEDEPKPHRAGPLKIPLKFDDAMKRAAKVEPPPEGWAKYERKPNGGRKRLGSK